MSSNAPKLVYPLASAELMFGIVQTTFSVILLADGQSIGLIMAFGALFITLRTVRALSTRVTEMGVSQLTWRGRAHLSWSEVTELSRRPLSLSLTGEKGRVVVPVEVFEDTDAAVAYIESRLPARLGRS